MKIASYRFPKFEEKIKAFNKKAAKWAMPLVEYMITEKKIQEVEVIVGENEERQAIVQKFDIEFFYVEIAGQIPKLNGWAVHSKVVPTEEKGVNYVYAQRGFEPVEKLRTTDMVCEHCNVNRRRTAVYLLQNEAGEQKLVGKSCLRDFLPETDPEVLLKYLENLNILIEEDGGSDDYRDCPRTAQVYKTDMAIAEALVMIKRDGFVSKKMCEDRGDLMPTSFFIGNTSKDRYKLYTDEELAIEFGSDDEQAAPGSEVQNVKDFINGKNASNNDFIYNLQIAVGQTACPYRMFAFIAAGVQMYIKSREEAVQKVEKSNEYLGTVGNRQDFQDLTLVRCIPVDGQFATMYVTGFEDQAGNSIVWFASKRIGDVGAVMSIKATVKKHEEFKGRHQTVVTRAAKL